MASHVRGVAGGIVALVELIDAHRGAFEYDWRTRFGKPLHRVGRSMTWGEARRLTTQLSADPTSHIAASIGGWEYPISREVLVLMDLFDLQHASKSTRRPRPYPRPWPDRTKRQARPTVSQAVVLEALRTAGHTSPPPLAVTSSQKEVSDV